MPEDNKPAPPKADTSAAAPDAKKQAAKPKLAIPVLQPREKIFFQIFVFSFALLLVDLVMIHPISNYLRDLDETIDLKEQVIPKKLLILKHKNHILNEYKSLKSFFVPSSMTPEEETAQFLREIERISKEVNFFVTNINPVKINKKTDTIYELSLDVEGRGGLKEVRRFIRAVESANPSICVSAFNLKPQSKDAEELKVLFSLVKMGVKKNHPLLSV